MWRHALASPIVRTVVGYAADLAMQPATQPWVALYAPAELNPEDLEDFCEMLTRTNARWLVQHPEAPDLYEFRPRYALRPEEWLAIPHAIRQAQRGFGLDCKVLAAWRVSELRVRHGQPRARCGWTRYVTPDKIVYHVWVLRQDGSREDPSVLLGMRSALPEPTYLETPWTLLPSSL